MLLFSLLCHIYITVWFCKKVLWLHRIFTKSVTTPPPPPFLVQSLQNLNWPPLERQKRLTSSAWRLLKTLKPDFISNIPNFDFVVLAETWNDDDIESRYFWIWKLLFYSVKQKSSKPSGRILGGITILYKDKLANAVSLIKTEKNYHLV